LTHKLRLAKVDYLHSSSSSMMRMSRHHQQHNSMTSENDFDMDKALEYDGHNSQFLLGKIPLQLLKFQPNKLAFSKF
jgi:hypothetical protein